MNWIKATSAPLFMPRSHETHISKHLLIKTRINHLKLWTRPTTEKADHCLLVCLFICRTSTSTIYCTIQRYLWVQLMCVCLWRARLFSFLAAIIAVEFLNVIMQQSACGFRYKGWYIVIIWLIVATTTTRINIPRYCGTPNLVVAHENLNHMRPGNGYYKEFQFEVSANTVESVMKIPLGLNLIST